MVLTCCEVYCLGAESVHATEAEYSHAESLVRAHQWNEGLAVLLPLVKLQPENLKALNLAALAYLGENDTKKAETYFRKAMAVDPAEKSREVLASFKDILDRQRSGNREKSQALSGNNLVLPTR